MQAPSWSDASRVDGQDVDMESPASGSTDSGNSSPTAQSAKLRKPTYIVRKEEKARLLEELDELQRKIVELKRAKEPQTGTLTLLEQELATSLLRDAVRTQQMSLVNVQSAVSGYVSMQNAIPHAMTISLGRDPQQRRDTLVGIKPRKMRAAVAYLAQRTRFVDPHRHFTEKSRFMLDSGDYCAIGLEIIPLEGVRVTVRQTFDAVLSYFANMEMRVMDVLGDITTRDETDYGADGIQQSRTVSNLSCGVPLEMNAIMNTEFAERSDEYADGGPFAVVTSDFVDQDELFPYSPHERVREDCSSVITIRSHTRKRLDPSTGREEDKSVVVLSCACFLKLHRTDMALPPLVQHRLREQLGRWGDIMFSSIIEHVQAQQPAGR